MSKPNDSQVITAAEARALFADWKAAPAVVLAVSGGPDSMALMWLAARWRRALTKGPRLLAITVDHGLRKEAAREARAVETETQRVTDEQRARDRAHTAEAAHAVHE